jgi:hypothetical protein
MNIELTREFLLWCTIINFGILMVWWLFFVVARDWMHRFHGKCTGMAVFKIGIILFNLVPLVVLYIIG